MQRTISFFIILLCSCTSMLVSSHEVIMHDPKSNFNSQSGYNANIKFTRPGSYDMTLRCYSQNHTLVADYSFQAYVI